LHPTKLFISQYNLNRGDILVKKSVQSKEEIPKKSEKTNEKKPKSKSMRKKILLILPIIAIICIIGFVWFTLTPEAVKAQLIIESGTVQVMHEGESWTSAKNGMLLYQSDSVKTANDTSASIVLFESSIIRLDSNTEVALQEIFQQAGETSVKIKQDSGRTWNTVLKISGIDDYEVQTPTTVASIRGTSFDVNIHSTGDIIYYISHGIVNVSIIENGSIFDTIAVKGNESVIAVFDAIDQPLEIIPFEKDEWVRKNQQRDKDLILLGKSSYIDFSFNVKEELYNRLDPYIPTLKEKYGVTDEELDVLLDGYLLGYYDLPPETPDWIREIIELS